MKGPVKHVAARSQLDEASQIHDADTAADMMHHSQIMGNKQIRQSQLLLQPLQHIDDLHLHGYVEGRNGLIAEHAFRLQGQGAGDADALPLAAAEFMGIALGRFGPQVDHLQESLYGLPPFLRRGAQAVIPQGFTDNVADGHTGVQG